ncbi:MAG: GTP 3',8-cyclase MoaA [Acidobacteriota bacterium]
MSPVDTLGRPLRSLRISVTDRCNLRCQYCMPEDDYTWLAREDVLHFEEISRLVDVCVGIGIDKVRLTGGEPLLRKDLPALVALLSRKPALTDIALTTNGVLLAESASALKTAGLRRVNVSLDTLRPDRFVDLTRQDMHARVIAGIETAAPMFGRLKIDCVVMRGVNDDELVPLLEYGARIGAEVRFIEYMDVGGATRWTPSLVVSRRELVERLIAHFGSVRPLEEPGSTAPADRFVLPDGRVFGVISSTTEPFCQACDRARITADGMFYTCLYGTDGLDLRAPLRADTPLQELIETITSRWTRRTDRGAEDRLAMRDRSVYLAVETLKADPHLEMHKRGG